MPDSAEGSVASGGGARRSPSQPPARGARSASPCARDAGGSEGGGGDGSGDARRPEPKARAVSLQRKGVGDAAPAVERKDVGKVPSYLKKRQEEMAEDKRRAARPVSPQAPPGHRKVSEEERSAALEMLKVRRVEVEKAQNSLPFNIETMGQKQREKDLHDRMAHIDKLHGLFSKPVVFVPLDAGNIAACIPPLPSASAGGGSGGGEGGGGGGDGAVPGGRGLAARPGSREMRAAAQAEQRLQVGSAAPWDFEPKSKVRTEVRVVAPPGGVSSLQLY